MEWFDEWTVATQFGYALKAYAYFPITWMKRILLGKEEGLKAYFKNCWGSLPESVLQETENRPVIWIEAQSMGEIGQFVSLSRELKRHFPDHAFVLSTHDEASLKLARQRLPLAGSFYSPWDIPWVCRRVVRLLRPKALLYVEHVKSPVLLREAHRQGALTVLISGFFPPGWERNRYLKRPVTCRFWEELDMAAVKEKEDADHLVSFGMKPDRISVIGDLKFDSGAIIVAEEEKQLLQEKFGLKRKPLLVAGSLHPHEIDFVLQGFLAARRLEGSLKLILAPRWIEDTTRIEAALSQYPIQVRRRSTLSSRDSLWQDVLILDTYGELASLYCLATAVFMGGSLPEKNGAWAGLCHNMIEPLLHQKPIFFGTNTHYRKRIVQSLKEIWPGLEVTTPEALGEGVVRIIRDSALLSAFETRAREIIDGQQGVVSRYVAWMEQAFRRTEPVEKPSRWEENELVDVNR